MTTYDGSYVIERLIDNANGDCTGAEARGQDKRDSNGGDRVGGRARGSIPTTYALRAGWRLPPDPPVPRFGWFVSC